MSVTFYVVKDGQIIENLVERELNELELNVSNSNCLERRFAHVSVS